MKIAAARLALAVILAVLAASAWAAGEETAPPVDWTRLGGARTVTVVTTNPDGSPKETTVWLVAVDGRGYIRTGSTRWAANVQRNPDILLRVGEEEIPVHVELMEEPEVRERVMRAFREKYGWFDRVIDPFRRGRPRIMRLDDVSS